MTCAGREKSAERRVPSAETLSSSLSLVVADGT